MTWNDLARNIAAMTAEQRGTDVTILLMNSNEIIAATDHVRDWSKNPDPRAVGLDQVDGILDYDHPYLTVIA